MALPVTLTTVPNVQERFRLGNKIDIDVIQPHLIEASYWMRDWVGNSAYDDACLGESTSDVTRQGKLKIAEEKMTYVFMLEALDVNVLQSGGASRTMKKGQDTITYLSPQEKAAKQRALKSQVMALIRDYAVKGTPTKAGYFIEIAEEPEDEEDT